MSLMRFNPEFQRCLWLELTPTRLMLMPILVVVVFGGLRLAEFDAMDDLFESVVFILLILWGSRLAADSFAEELVERTWDVQRLSAASPWGLALGKLLGGTATAWYGVALSAVAYAVWGDPAAHDITVASLAAMVVAGLLAQSGSLLAVLAFHRFEGSGRQRGALTIAQLLGIGAALGLWFDAVDDQGGASLTWYGMAVRADLFALAIQAILAGWLVVGAANLIRRDLGERNTPLPWLGFYAFCVVVGWGMLGGQSGRIAQYIYGPLAGYGLSAAVIGAAIGVTLAYVALLSTPLSLVDLKRLRMALAGRRWREAWTLLPSFVPLAALTIAFALAAAAFAARDQELVIGWIGIMLRDVAIVVWIRLAAQRRTTLFLGVLAFLLYGLLPFVLDKIGGPIAASWLLPKPGSGVMGMMGPWLLAVVAGVMAWRKWRRLAPA